MKVKNSKNPFFIFFGYIAKEPNRETWQIFQKKMLKEDLAKFGYTLGMKVKKL